MKRVILFTITLFLLLSVCASAAIVYVPDSQLRFKVLRYDPAPVQAGDQFTVWVELTNEDSYDDYNDVSVKVISGDPFYVVGDNTVALGNLKKGSSQFFNFKMRADKSALAGIYDLKFEVKFNGIIKTIDNVEIELKSRDAFFNIETVTLEPEILSPGSKGKLTLLLKNNAGTFLSDVNIVLGLTNESIPLVPIGSTVTKNIPRIEANSEYEVTYDLFVLADAESKAYRLPVSITYYDASGVNYSRTNYIGVLIGAEPEYLLSLKSSDARQKGSNGKVVVSISNTGPSDLKFLSINLLPSEEYVVVSADEQYIGNLESDDYETAEYDIHVNKGEDGIVKLMVGLEYKDSYNNLIEKTEVLEMKIYRSSQLSMYGLSAPQSGLFTYILYLALIIYFFMAYKEWKKDKDITKALKKAAARFLRGIFNIIRGLRWRNIKRWPTKIRLFLMKNEE